MNTDVLENELQFKWYLSVFEDEGKTAFIVDEDSIICDLTAEAAKQYGGNKEDFIGRSLFGFDERYDAEIIEKLSQRILKKGKISFKTYHQTLTGREIRVNIKAYQICGSNDHFLVLIDHVEDFFKGKVNRELLSSVLDSIGILIAITNKNGEIEYVNDAFSLVTGYKKTELIGESTKMFNTGYHSASFYQKMWDSLSKGEPFSGHFRNKKKSEEVFWEKFEIYPIVDDEENITHFLKVAHDVTAEVEAKEHLVERKAQFQSLFEYNYSIMLLVDPISGIIEKANNAALDYYGYRDTEIEGQHISLINMTPKETLEKKLKNVVYEQGGVFRFKHRLASGEVKEVEVYSGPILFEGKVMLYSIVRDITDAVSAYNQLAQAKRNAERANRLKSEFLAIMSHELKTPLNAMIGFSDLIRVDSKEEDVRNYASFIYKAGIGLNTLISDIFDLALLHSEQQKVNSKSFLLKEMWDEVVDIVTGAYRDNDLEKIFELKVNENVVLVSDKEKVTQILINLVNNAFKYTEKGYVKLKARMKSDKLLFSIEDSGIGIKEENKKKIFDYFVQGEGATRRKIGGAGIGLAVSKGFCDLLGGKIWLESELNKGTTFYFQLPLKIAREIQTSLKFD
ncbi:PAS domain S-box protein [Prolixibacteraceae bacterium JC049]|nr:PAS domain S-box protein [Prolixibacteraceae bacterium JC049]